MLKDALGHDDFDVMTDFVEAGLTSISAMRFAANIYNKFNCEIKSNVLLNDYNIFKVENFITECLLEKKENVNVENNQELEEVELTQVQLGVYYETMKNPNSSIYNIPLEITLSKDLDIERLKDSFEAVLNNHSFVKTTLKQDEGKILLVKNETPAIVGKKEMSEVEYHEFRKTFSTPFVMINSKLYKACTVKTDKNCYVLFDIHHILFDGMSESVFIRELFDLYEGKGAKKEDVSFFEYAKKENENQNSDSYKNAEKYFNKLLSKFETSSEIKSDMNKSTSQGELKELSVPVDKSLVNEFCKTNNITPAQLFLSASGYAISRFVNSKDVYISTISSGRSDVRLQNTFGMFVKTLPLHVEIKNNSSVLDFINKTGEMFRNVIDNEIYPYTKIAQNFGFEPKIVYACQLGIVEDMTLGNKKAEFSSLGLNTPKFPLSIHIEENQQQEILINLQYNDALYSKELIETFANAMNTTLLNMMKNPNGNIEKVSMLNETDLKLIDSFKMSASEELETKLFHKLFENAVDKNLDKTALIATDGEFTYLELEQEANKVANCLLEKGVQIEDKIAILLPRTSDFFKTLFGVLKSGAAYIPCDIEYPKERINEILIDSGAKYIITNESKVGDYSNALDIKELLNNSDISRPNIAVKPENLAYMIYTSGSTGKPKGVMIEHRGISNYVTPHKENRHIYAFVNEVNTMLSITTVSFDMALKEFGSALCNGKTLVFANDEETKNVISLTELFNRTKVDAFNTTPSRMQQYLEYEDFVNELKNCKVIMCGAENYPMSLYKKLKSCTNARLFNTYGPTEITVSSNCLEMTDDTKQITIGKPLLNYKEFVVDCDGNELPIGVMGELYIGGQNIARGYKNLEQQTAEKFVEHNGVRVYKSGDFAKWTNNGEISILGRMDNQVKLRGLRIELDEIQNAINSFENVKSSVVVVKKINGTENLCAYFEAENQIDIEALKDALKNRLPQYMVPSAFLQMEKLPITRNGKVDKKNLPDIEVEKAVIIKSRNNVEKDFCEIFAKVLNLNEVSIEDNFFEIGGSSLLVTSVIVEAQKRNYNINYSDVFAEKTPKNLAKIFADNIEIDENSEFSNYDYSKINELLSKNNIEAFLNGEKQELGNVLITGTTGFLGIHMLTEFLQNENGKAYCLLRKGEFDSAKERLKSLIFYYFSDEFEEYFKDRLIVIEGDITSQKTFENLKQYDIDTVINCAANVKHFSEKNDIEEVNYNGVLNIIDYCKNNNKRLIQVSTMSIGGVNINDNLPENTKLNEQMLYFNQTLNGKYIISKFKAERAILEAVTNGLNAKIMRVGNLAARDVDGEFQINFKTNAFVGRLKAFKIIKKYPYSMVNANVEFSPIDLVAKAILLLAKAPKECVVFHPFNNHSIFMGDVIKTMQNMNMEIDFAEDNDFGAQLKKVQEDSENAKILSSLIAYQNIGHGKKVGLIGKENDYTIKILFRLGFSWSISSAEYMTKLLDVLQGLRFFGK